MEKEKKSHFSIRTILLIIISILNVLITGLVGSGVYKSWRSLEQAKTLNQRSAIINLLFDANKHLSLARGAALSVLYAPPQITDILQTTYIQNRQTLDQEINEALDRIGSDEVPAASITEIRIEYQALQALYKRLDASLMQPKNKRDLFLPVQVFNASTRLTEKIRDLITVYSRPLQDIDATVVRQMTFKYSIWDLTEYAGQEYALIGQLIAEKKLPMAEQRDRLVLLRERIRYGWEIIREFPLNESLTQKLESSMDEAESHYFETFSSMKDFFYRPADISRQVAYPISAEVWLELASQAVDSLLALQDTVLQETQNHIRQNEEKAEHAIFISAIIFLSTITLSLYFWRVIILRVTRPVNAMVNTLYKATQGEVYDPPHIIYHDDEIGKLASVLTVFQENARKIKQSNEELERYAYIAAHDLKSPLRAIDNISQWIEEDLNDVMTDQLKEHLDMLRKRVHRMEKLLNDTLEYSRIDQQAQNRNNEIINGKTLVEDAISFIASHQRFTIILDKNFSDIYLNRMPLQQIFFNLINNAIKHHDKEMGIIEVNVKEEPAQYIFSIKDDGPGIPKQYHETIFEMFRTLKSRDQQEGSGMGLAFVKKILTTCGGTITIESEFGQGAVFRFTWPKMDNGRQ